MHQQAGSLAALRIQAHEIRNVRNAEVSAANQLVHNRRTWDLGKMPAHHTGLKRLSRYTTNSHGFYESALDIFWFLVNTKIQTNSDSE